jgi:hypothetical protein
MMFLKEHLAGSYEWMDEAGQAVYTGEASRRKFDRFNGNQMLFIINLFGSATDRFSVNEGRKLEDMVMNHLPLEAKSEISVFNWLQKMFNVEAEVK